MPRRRRENPDTRLDWRDPNMPVLRKWEDNWGQVSLVEITPKKNRNFAAMRWRAAY